MKRTQDGALNVRVIGLGTPNDTLEDNTIYALLKSIVNELRYQ